VLHDKVYLLSQFGIHFLFVLGSSVDFIQLQNQIVVVVFEDGVCLFHNVVVLHRVLLLLLIEFLHK
jgi:hypothetical protein